MVVGFIEPVAADVGDAEGGVDVVTPGAHAALGIAAFEIVQDAVGDAGIGIAVATWAVSTERIIGTVTIEPFGQRRAGY